MKTFILSIIILACQLATAQVLLEADGSGDTYDLITSILAPGQNPIETPDCSHPDFGDHIDEIYDEELDAFVFRFFIHTSPDDDRCINFDRQRNEIKSYDKSPANLKGIQGETVVYKWKFKLDEDFQSSPKFTHIHQLKAVGGSESSMPMITMTTRLGSPDVLEIRHAESLTQNTIHEKDLAPFKGVWLEVEEIVTYGEVGTGSYAITIKRVSDNETLLDYANSNLRMWKTDAEFVRPKWGIYRSTVWIDDLRDEEVLFASFSIEEIEESSTEENLESNISIFPNPASNHLTVEGHDLKISDVELFTLNGDQVFVKISQNQDLNNLQLDLSELPTGVYLLKTKNKVQKLTKL